MSSRSADYRRRASVCESIVRQMRQASQRQEYEDLLYEDMGRQFRDMAEQAEIDEE
jgi:hypothetical protein